MRRAVINAAQRLLASVGMRLSHIPSCIEPTLPFDVLELAVAKVLQEERDRFYFIQVGANDGLMNDFLNRLIRKYRLRGCLVEPLPDVFERLKCNYADQPQLEFRNVMIGEEDGVGEIHRFAPGAPVPHAFFHGLARSDSEYIRARARAEGLDQHIETVRCQQQTVASLLASLPSDHLSMLYVDTEGSDDRIVNSTLQTGAYPTIINYEWSEMPLQRRCDLKIGLADNGYRFIDVGPDTVCLRITN